MDISILDTAIDNQLSLDLRHVREVLGAKYDIEKVIGTGGMGNVYLAKDLTNNETLAIKVLHKEYCSEASLLARFIREAELLKKVSNPNVVKVLDAGSNSELTYYAMEYVPGVTLEDYLKNDDFPIEKLPKFMVKMCEALASIHDQGIIHRDLKPANIILTEALEPKITDFGIARIENSQLTHHNEILGSVFYIAPEIWIGEEPTLSVDLYGLGIILYEVVTGATPFEGSSPGELMRKHLQSQVVPPKEINPLIPSYINRLILRLLSKQRTERPRDATEVINIIQRHISVSTAGQSFKAYRADTQEFLRAVDENTAGALSKVDRVKSEARITTVNNPKITDKESANIQKNYVEQKQVELKEEKLEIESANDKVFTLGSNNFDSENNPDLSILNQEESKEDLPLLKFAKILAAGIILLSSLAGILYFS